MGYCYCDTHKGYISNNLAVTHNCLHKNKGEKCPFLKVNEDLRNYNQFISDKEKDKHKKELYKRLRKLYYDNTIKFNEYNRYQKLISKGIPVNDILDKLERKYKKKELI